MTAAQLVVTAAGAAAITWELWYFRPAGSSAAAAPAGVQELRVVVRGGYTPETLVVRAGVPVRLRFYRDETADCSARVVFDTLGIERDLPPFETTIIDLPAPPPGEHAFRCGRDVLHGRLVVEDAEAPRDPAASPHERHV